MNTTTDNDIGDFDIFEDISWVEWGTILILSLLVAPLVGIWFVISAIGRWSKEVYAAIYDWAMTSDSDF